MNYFGRIQLIGLTAALLLSPAAGEVAAGGEPGRIDRSFDAGSGIDGIVRLVARQPDGKVVIAGEFGTVRGLRRVGLARLHADGSGDPTFDPGDAGVGVYLLSLALQPDGKVLVGGPEGIFRLNPDGSRDLGFRAAPLEAISVFGFPSLGVNSIAVQPDGKIVVGGVFSIRNGISTRYGVARLHRDGTLDTGFTASVGGYVESGPYFPFEGVGAVALASDGKVLVGGWFSQANGVPRSNVARLHADGGLDTGFHSGGAIEGFVRIIVPQPDGKTLLGGDFTTASRSNRSIARLNPNGSPDTTFVSGTELYETVSAIALQPDGRVLVAGGVNVYGWAGDPVVRLNPDGGRDESFRLDTGGLRVGAAAVVMEPEGTMLVAGGYWQTTLVRLDGRGAVDNSFAPHAATGILPGIPSNSVRAVVVQPDGKVLLAATGVVFESGSLFGITRLEADGTRDERFLPGAGVEGSGVDVIAVQADGRVLIGGDFEDAGRTRRLALARLDRDGGLDGTFSPELESLLPDDDCPPDAELFGIPCWTEAFVITALTVQADERLLVGGYRVVTTYSEFGGFRSIYRSFVARLGPDGHRDPGFETAMPQAGLATGIVSVLVEQADGKVIMAGWFASVNGVPRHGVARLNADGSVDGDFDPGEGVGGDTVHAVALQADGGLVIGGDFAFVAGIARAGIARLGPEGAVDETFDPGPGVAGTVRALALDEEGRVIVGGALSTRDGADRPDVVRLRVDGRLDPTFQPAPGPDAPVKALAVQADGRVLIAGDFAMVDGVLRPRIARLHGGMLPPRLAIARSGGFVVLTWPDTGAGSSSQLQAAHDLSPSAVWLPVSEPVVFEAGMASVRVPIGAGAGFFRLQILRP